MYLCTCNWHMYSIGHEECQRCIWFKHLRIDSLLCSLTIFAGQLRTQSSHKVFLNLTSTDMNSYQQIHKPTYKNKFILFVYIRHCCYDLKLCYKRIVTQQHLLVYAE